MLTQQFISAQLLIALRPLAMYKGGGLGADVYVSVCVCGGGGLGQAKNRIKTNRTNIIATNFV